MARSFRIVDKKRGHRRTGSRGLGLVAELVFFAALCLLGLGGLVALLAAFIVPQWRVNHEFFEHTPGCTVLNKRLVEVEGEEGLRYRPEIRIEYEIDGETYIIWTYDIATVLDQASSYSSSKEGGQQALQQFSEGRQYPCWYDPTDPNIAVLQRGYRWWVWVLLVVPGSFLLIGGGGLIYALLHWGTSAEYRSVITQRVQEGELFGGNGRGEPKFPNVPDGSDITNSPGTRLKFRLPIGTSPGWALLGALIFCLLWNGIVVVVAIAVGGQVRGNPWFLSLFILPFAAIGIGSLAVFARQLVVTTGIGPTLVEISDHPLRPGGQYGLFLAQSGRRKLHRLDVALVCEEQAAYRQGTDARSETRQVYHQRLFHGEGFQVRHGEPFQAECRFTVPAAAMHSFHSPHNQITWKLVVQGEAAGWPPFERSFPVILCPAQGGNGP